MSFLKKTKNYHRILYILQEIVGYYDSKNCDVS